MTTDPRIAGDLLFGGASLKDTAADFVPLRDVSIHKVLRR
jgi:hypothetical protein